MKEHLRKSILEGAVSGKALNQEQAQCVVRSEGRVVWVEQFERRRVLGEPSEGLQSDLRGPRRPW